MDLEQVYQTNQDFKDYIDAFLRNEPNLTREKLLSHKIVSTVADYYLHKNDGRLDNGRNEE